MVRKRVCEKNPLNSKCLPGVGVVPVVDVPGVVPEAFCPGGLTPKEPSVGIGVELVAEFELKG
jgi:hypothetical protein